MPQVGFRSRIPETVTPEQWPAVVAIAADYLWRTSALLCDLRWGTPELHAQFTRDRTLTVAAHVPGDGPNPKEIDQTSLEVVERQFFRGKTLTRAQSTLGDTDFGRCLEEYEGARERFYAVVEGVLAPVEQRALGRAPTPDDEPVEAGVEVT